MLSSSYSAFCCWFVVFFFKPPRLQNTHHSEVSFSLQFHAKPLQLETDVQPFITFAADRLCRGSCAQAMFGVSHLRASGWWVWRKKLCEAEQFFPASACAWGPTGRRDRRWTLLIFIFLNFFFFLLSLETGAEILFSYVKARCCMEASCSPASTD